MVKHNELISSCANMLFKLFLFSILLQNTLGFDIADDEKQLIHLSPTGKDRLLAALDDKTLTGGLIAYPRLGRHVWEIQQALIPYPRAGRLLIDPSSMDYDIILNADAGDSGLEDSLTDAFLNREPVVQKRRNVKLIPRIGRKKRSISGEGEKKETEKNGEEPGESDNRKPPWNTPDDLDNEYYFRTDKAGIQSKNPYAESVGKQLSDYFNNYEEKRAAAFTPRIGRASFIPRIGRSDPRFRLKNRAAAFVPRIGRRAALIPRIGRSGNQRPIEDGAD